MVQNIIKDHQKVRFNVKTEDITSFVNAVFLVIKLNAPAVWWGQSTWKALHLRKNNFVKNGIKIKKFRQVENLNLGCEDIGDSGCLRKWSVVGGSGQSSVHFLLRFITSALLTTQHTWQTLPEAQRTHGIEPITWVYLSATWLHIWPPDGATCIDYKFGPPGGGACISYKLGHKGVPLA